MFVAAAGAAGDLADLLEAALGRAQVAAGEAQVGIDHADQGPGSGLEVVVIGLRRRLGRRMGLRRPPDGAMGAPFLPQGGSGYPSKVLIACPERRRRRRRRAPSRRPRPTAKRRAVLCRLDGVASSVTMHKTSLPPSSLPDNKCQPVTTASGAEGRPFRVTSSEPGAS